MVSKKEKYGTDWNSRFERYGPWAPVAVDSIITRGDRIVLIKRKNPPFRGCWALPGGFHEMGETVEETCIREAKEETGLDTRIKDLVGVFSKPGRDPRGQSISVVFETRIKDPRDKNTSPKGGDDAERAKFFSLSELPELAFDHDDIIELFKNTR